MLFLHLLCKVFWKDRLSFGTTVWIAFGLEGVGCALCCLVLIYQVTQSLRCPPPNVDASSLHSALIVPLPTANTSAVPVAADGQVILPLHPWYEGVVLLTVGVETHLRPRLYLEDYRIILDILCEQQHHHKSFFKCSYPVSKYPLVTSTLEFLQSPQIWHTSTSWQEAYIPQLSPTPSANRPPCFHLRSKLCTTQGVVPIFLPNEKMPTWEFDDLRPVKQPVQGRYGMETRSSGLFLLYHDDKDLLPRLLKICTHETIEIIVNLYCNRYKN